MNSTKVQNPRHVNNARTRESLKAHALMKWLGITESIRKTSETKEKEAHCLTSSRIPGSVQPIVSLVRTGGGMSSGAVFC